MEFQRRFKSFSVHIIISDTMVREITNQEMLTIVDGMERYADPLLLNTGYLVSRTFPCRGYVKKNAEYGDAWLPSILVIKPNDNDIKVFGRNIAAASPSEVNLFQLVPSYGEYKQISDKEVLLHEVKDAFVTQEDVANIMIRKFDITGDADNVSIGPGVIMYSGIDHRDITLHGEADDLEKMLSQTMENFPERTYDLKFQAPCSANGKKEYKIQISDEEVSESVKKMLKEINK